MNFFLSLLSHSSTRSCALLLCVFVSSCVGNPAAPTEFFILNSTAKVADAVNIKPFKLGIGPVELADYLNQGGIAYHSGNNQITYAEDRRWAEPLDGNISQVLLSNLSTMLPAQVVYPFPWKVSQAPDFQIRINITRFGWFPKNTVSITAVLILENKDDDILFSKQETLDLVATGSGYEEIVTAQNVLLEKLSLRLVKITQSTISKSLEGE